MSHSRVVAAPGLLYSELQSNLREMGPDVFAARGFARPATPQSQQPPLPFSHNRVHSSAFAPQVRSLQPARLLSDGKNHLAPPAVERARYQPPAAPAAPSGDETVESHYGLLVKIRSPNAGKKSVQSGSENLELSGRSLQNSFASQREPAAVGKNLMYEYSRIEPGYATYSQNSGQFVRPNSPTSPQFSQSFENSFATQSRTFDAKIQPHFAQKQPEVFPAPVQRVFAESNYQGNQRPAVVNYSDSFVQKPPAGTIRARPAAASEIPQSPVKNISIPTDSDLVLPIFHVSPRNSHVEYKQFAVPVSPKNRQRDFGQLTLPLQPLVVDRAMFEEGRVDSKSSQKLAQQSPGGTQKEASRAAAGQGRKAEEPNAKKRRNDQLEHYHVLNYEPQSPKTSSPSLAEKQTSKSEKQASKSERQAEAGPKKSAPASEQKTTSKFVELELKDVGFYHGELQNNQMHGKGQLFDHQRFLLYEGQFSNGEFHGLGNLKMKFYDSFPDSEAPHIDLELIQNCAKSYSGHFSHSRFNGTGKIKYSNDAEFFGEFSNGVAEGSGIWSGNDGQIIGYWSQNKLQYLE